MTATAGKMPKISKDEGAISSKDLDAARRYIGVIRTTTRDPMVFFDKIKKADIVAALVAMNWYLDLLPDGLGYDYFAAAAHMAKSVKVKDVSVVANAVKDVDKTRLLKYMDGPLLHDESVHTSSQWRVPIKGRDAAYSGPDVSVISAPTGSGAAVGAGVDVPVVGEEEDVEDSSGPGLTPPGGHVPSAQDAPLGPGAGVSTIGGDNGDNSDDDNSGGGSDGDGIGGKVSGHSSCSVRSHAAPPRQLANAGVVADDGLVDKDAKGSAVARVDGAGDVDGDRERNNKAPNSTSSSVWRPRVCNRVWKGKQCPNMSSGCRFAHPTPCTNGRCKSGPAPGCRAFHPARRGNDRGSERKGGGAPKVKGGNVTRRPNNRRSGTSNSNNSGGSGSNRRSSNNHTDLHLRKRVEMMERKLELQTGKAPPSYRDVAARGLHAPHIGAGSGNNNLSNQRRASAGFGLAQPSPDMLGAVVAAVMAALTGKGQHF